MFKNTGNLGYAALLVIVISIIVMGPLLGYMQEQRLILGIQDVSNIISPWEIPQEAVGMLISGAILGGFRGIAADLLWMQGEEYWHTGRWWDMLPLMKAVTMLDPHFVEVWRSAAWHIAYNLGAEVNSPLEKRKFIKAGLDLLEQGIRKNMDTWELYFEAGWINVDKGANPQAAAEYFEKAAQFPDAPDVNYHILAHAYEDTADIGEALGAWQKSLEVNPDDRIAQGAITTIQLRYVPAWREYRRGNIKEALRLLYKHLNEEDPEDKIALHFIARIYEEQGRLDEAVAIWEKAAATRAMDYYAALKVDELKAKIAGTETDEGDIYKDLEKYRRQGPVNKPAPNQRLQPGEMGTE